DERVAAVVIAGDLYDGDRDDYQTAVFLQRQLHRLRDAGIRVVIVYGNHDAESEITRRLSLPDNTTVLPTDAPDVVIFEDLGVAFHGRSYPSRAVIEDITADYPAPRADLLNVGVLHTSLNGRPGHASYAPCTVDGLVRRGYQYWALGHVHLREVVDKDGTTIVFPGNICGRHVGETGSKGVTIVEYDGDRIDSAVHRDVAPVRWHRLDVDAADALSADDVTERVVERLAAVRETEPAPLHAVRLDVVTGSRAYGQWARDPEQWETQLRADAAGSDVDIWIERLDLRASERDRATVSDEALGAIAESIARLRDEAGRETVDELMAGLRSRFGPQRDAAIAMGAIGLDQESFADLADAAEALLAAELGAGA
ncbi:MAG: metallophosphoesterase family protein, partial [Acidimicrobiales bacterium]